MPQIRVAFRVADAPGAKAQEKQERKAQTEGGLPEAAQVQPEEREER